MGGAERVKLCSCLLQVKAIRDREPLIALGGRKGYPPLHAAKEGGKGFEILWPKPRVLVFAAERRLHSAS